MPVLLPYPHEFAETDCAELGGRDISCAPRVLERPQGFVDALGGHLKRAEMHGDDDQIVPFADSAPLSAKLLKNGTLKVYEKLPHGMCTTHADVINPDLLAFVSS